ncbi:MAG: hypothetical protein M1828_003662 [Chrysothrix sp. TS-e1954]|nr:MAG: hypothetical protein M1828_003662 [Chrysothrix sp. TS-e1954]
MAQPYVYTRQVYRKATEDAATEASPRPNKRVKLSQEEKWVAEEDTWALKQARRRATIRVQEGRGKPVDWLCLTLRFMNATRDAFDDEVADSELGIVDPQNVMASVDEAGLEELAKDIDTYLTLEEDRGARDFWNTMLVVCNDRRKKTVDGGRRGRGVGSVSGDIEKLFSTKSIKELEALESQIKVKLESNEPIDVEYWEHLLSNLVAWKARANLRMVSQMVMDSQFKGLRDQQADEAGKASERLEKLNSLHAIPDRHAFGTSQKSITSKEPQPALRVETQDQGLKTEDEDAFLRALATKQRSIVKVGCIPSKAKPLVQSTLRPPSHLDKNNSTAKSGRNNEPSRAATLLYEREVARGVGENEEVFAGEEEVPVNDSQQQSPRDELRKPRYFNKVITGYEWNKYNQTHYDHDNPPPKQVQGYSFNILYPELVSQKIAPTFRIEREHGRRRGQSFAPAGESETCVIHFIAGPPYLDIAFRIVDREWDYSGRTFLSQFSGGCLRLSFQFKRVFYRK